MSSKEEPGRIQGKAGKNLRGRISVWLIVALIAAASCVAVYLLLFKPAPGAPVDLPEAAAKEFEMGRLAAEIEDWELATSCFIKADDARPGAPQVLDALARAYDRRKSCEVLAMASYGAYLHLDSSSPNAKYACQRIDALEEQIRNDAARLFDQALAQVELITEQDPVRRDAEDLIFRTRVLIRMALRQASAGFESPARETASRLPNWSIGSNMVRNSTLKTIAFAAASRKSFEAKPLKRIALPFREDIRVATAEVEPGDFVKEGQYLLKLYLADWKQFVDEPAMAMEARSRAFFEQGRKLSMAEESYYSSPGYFFTKPSPLGEFPLLIDPFCKMRRYKMNTPWDAFDKGLISWQRQMLENPSFGRPGTGEPDIFVVAPVRGQVIAINPVTECVSGKPLLEMLVEGAIDSPTRQDIFAEWQAIRSELQGERLFEDRAGYLKGLRGTAPMELGDELSRAARKLTLAEERIRNLVDRDAAAPELKR